MISGSLIAFLVKKSIADLNLLFEGKNSTSLYYQEVKKENFSFYQWLSLLTACGVFASLFLITSIQIQLIVLPLILLITRFKNIKIVYYAWPFYFYLAWLHLFRTDGIYIYKDWITREGLDRFIFFTVRTTNIIICGQWLSRYISGVWRKISREFLYQKHRIRTATFTGAVRPQPGNGKGILSSNTKSKFRQTLVCSHKKT